MNKMLKILGVVIVGAMMVGCTPTTTEVSANFIMPRGLEDCQLYRMNNSDGTFIYVMRCPTVTSTTRAGKNPTYTISENY